MCHQNLDISAYKSAGECEYIWISRAFLGGQLNREEMSLQNRKLNICGGFGYPNNSSFSLTSLQTRRKNIDQEFLVSRKKLKYIRLKKMKLIMSVQIISSPNVMQIQILIMGLQQKV